MVAHGSSLPESKVVYKEIAIRAGEKSGMEVKVGYMKHWKPTIAEAVQYFVEKGLKKIIIVPLFFVPGQHVANDIPRILGLKEGDPPEFGYGKLNLPDDVEIVYARHIGADDRLAQVVVDRVKEVVR
ncbi:MAG: CbiX/SirB N-terminal domain-containing protein [Candidatus Hydrothermarchaeaceae archaeon]